MGETIWRESKAVIRAMGFMRAFCIPEHWNSQLKSGWLTKREAGLAAEQLFNILQS
jgi:hypothetical protein